MSTEVKLRPQSPGRSDLRPQRRVALRGRRGRAGPIGPGSQAIEPRSASRLLPATRGELTLAPAPEAPVPQIPRLGRGWAGPGGRGGTDSPSQPSLGIFSEFPVGKGAPTVFEKRAGEGMNIIFHCPASSPHSLPVTPLLFPF